MLAVMAVMLVVALLGRGHMGMMGTMGMDHGSGQAPASADAEPAARGQSPIASAPAGKPQHGH